MFFICMYMFFKAYACLDVCFLKAYVYLDMHVKLDAFLHWKLCFPFCLGTFGILATIIENNILYMGGIVPACRQQSV